MDWLAWISLVTSVWVIYIQDGEVLFSLETFPIYRRLKPLICHYFGMDINCQAPPHYSDNESKKGARWKDVWHTEWLLPVGSLYRRVLRYMGKPWQTPMLWRDLGAEWVGKRRISPCWWCSATSRNCWRPQNATWLVQWTHLMVPSSHSSFLLWLII